MTATKTFSTILIAAVLVPMTAAAQKAGCDENGNCGNGGFSSCDTGFGSIACNRVPIQSSGDPNDKVGSRGAGDAHFLAGAPPMRYSILFENQATAALPAQEVVITDRLDSNTLDLSTFAVGPIAFGSKLITPAPGLNNFSGTVDLRPDKNLLVSVNASLDSQTGIASWRFISLDPSTLQLITDPAAGFLPPNINSPEGQGSVFFTVNQREALATGTQVLNQASIVFDRNAPIATPTWLNTIDNSPPTSRVIALPATESSTNFTVRWAGTDMGSGIQDFTVYVSDSGGPFKPFQANTTAMSATFTGQVNHTYGFYSIARDLVGNVEATKSEAEATTQVTLVTDTTPPVTIASVSPRPNAAGWNNSNVTITLNSRDNEPGGSGVKQITYSTTGAQTIATVVNGASTTFTISAEGITTITFFGTDNAGNIESAETLTVQLDSTPPSLSLSVSGKIPRVVTISAQDTGSGLKDVTYSLDGVTYLPYTAPISIGSPNAMTVHAAADDIAGNHATATFKLLALGDVNGDGVVDCADLAIVKASFGTKVGQVGFDPRADVNGDGVVNVLDLSIVARQLPAGTTCH